MDDTTKKPPPPPTLTVTLTDELQTDAGRLRLTATIEVEPPDRLTAYRAGAALTDAATRALRMLASLSFENYRTGTPLEGR